MNPPLEVSRQPLRILVVEDHEGTLDALLHVLERLGHQVTGAISIREAACASCAAHFDMLISDISLPGGDGWELLRRLRVEECEPGRSIAISIYASPERVQKSKAEGDHLHLQKPFSFAALKAALNEAAAPSRGT